MIILMSGVVSTSSQAMISEIMSRVDSLSRNTENKIENMFLTYCVYDQTDICLLVTAIANIRDQFQYILKLLFKNV